jgi:CBS domain-containing protein
MITSSITNLCVADLMTLDPIVVIDTDGLDDAKDLMERYRISGLPVVDAQQRLVGVISTTDLALSTAPHVSDVIRRRWHDLRVGELMSAPAITVDISASIRSAAALMTREHVHRLVATNQSGVPVGVLSASDIVALVAEEAL